jgi:prepilin-type N-terminal cleavage/methylation domain-containing protein
MGFLPCFRNSRGLTLIEILVALVIIGILATLAAPSFTAWLERSTVKKTARQLVTDLQFAKMKAVAEGVQYRVSFNNTNGSYVVQRGNAATDSGSWTTIGIERGLADKTNPYYAKGVTMKQNYPGAAVVFSPVGSSGMGTVKLSTGACADGTVVCQTSPSRACEKCVRTILTGRVALVQ